MQSGKLYIKNMVCTRCIEAVQSIFHNANIPFEKVVLGEVTVPVVLKEPQLTLIKQQLQNRGFDILEDKKATIVEKVKNLVIQYIYHPKQQTNIKFSEYLASNTGYEYTYITGIFSANQGITIEKYVILQKIERAKELLTYNELTLSEIAYELTYSSVAALSAQFKDVTGMTPTEFKKLSHPDRKSLDSVITK